jgi:hypothetical protein
VKKQAVIPVSSGRIRVMYWRFRILLSVALLAAALPARMTADAIVVSQAMFASTIAEFFVEEDHVRVELEIGVGDAAAFRNILPDALYEQLGFGSEPLRQRIGRLFSEDLAIRVDGEPLEGRIQSMAPRARARRDAVTGEPLPASESEAEIVIAATLIYPFDALPEALTLAAPSGTGVASIGFVLYHRGIPVNDFRYLSSGFTVQLDWDDPWYSAFPRGADGRLHLRGAIRGAQGNHRPAARSAAVGRPRPGGAGCHPCGSAGGGQAPGRGVSGKPFSGPDRR